MLIKLDQSPTSEIEDRDRRRRETNPDATFAVDVQAADEQRPGCWVGVGRCTEDALDRLVVEQPDLPDTLAATVGDNAPPAAVIDQPTAVVRNEIVAANELGILQHDVFRADVVDDAEAIEERVHRTPVAAERVKVCVALVAAGSELDPESSVVDRLVDRQGRDPEALLQDARLARPPTVLQGTREVDGDRRIDRETSRPDPIIVVLSSCKLTNSECVIRPRSRRSASTDKACGNRRQSTRRRRR
jgi:hypothetical protein